MCHPVLISASYARSPDPQWVPGFRHPGGQVTNQRTTTEQGLGAAWQVLTIQAYRTYGYWCYWCHKPIDPALPKTHRYSKTVDHLDERRTHGTAIPHISRVRPMHRACNAQRSAAPQQPTRRQSRDW